MREGSERKPKVIESLCFYCSVAEGMGRSFASNHLGIVGSSTVSLEPPLLSPPLNWGLQDGVRGTFTLKFESHWSNGCGGSSQQGIKSLH